MISICMDNQKIINTRGNASIDTNIQYFESYKYLNYGKMGKNRETNRKKYNIRAPALWAKRWEKQSLGAGYTGENHWEKGYRAKRIKNVEKKSKKTGENTNWNKKQSFLREGL